MSERPTCATCPYYDADVETIAYEPSAAVMPAKLGRMKGGCRKDPYSTPHKRPDDWCGQHVDFPLHIHWLQERRRRETP